MAALPQAPNDLRLNQRLAALHTRASRFAEAGVCCRTLQNVYSTCGYPEEATRYGELAGRYEERSAASALADASVQHSTSAAIPEEAPSIAVASIPWPTTSPVAAEAAEFAIVDDSTDNQNDVQHGTQPAAPVAESRTAPAEIDLSSEWDDAITIEADASSAEPAESEITDVAGAREIPATKLDQGRHEQNIA